MRDPEIHKRYVKKRREELWDSYVRSLIQKHNPDIEVTAEMIVAKRANIIAILEAKERGEKPPSKIMFSERKKRKDIGKQRVTYIVCKTCDVNKRREEFSTYTRKDGYKQNYYECKSCKNDRANARRERFLSIEIKMCPMCETEKPVSDFGTKTVSSGVRGGGIQYRDVCKKCHVKRQKDRVKNDPDKEKYRRWNRNYKKNNPEKTKKLSDKANRKKSQEITDSFVVDVLKNCKGFTSASRKDLFTDKELIETKRVQIKLIRAIKEIENGNRKTA